MKTQKGITLVALIVTIIVLIILSTVVIQQVIGDGIIRKADEAKLVTDYQTVREGVNLYKSEKLIETKGEKVTDESLIGSVYKKVYVADTYRNLAVIVDFEEIDSKPIYGQGGEKLLAEDNDKTAIKEIATLSELIDVYLIDLTDGTLYYVNGKQVYALDIEKVEVEDSAEKKYAIETINDQKQRFITKWNVTLGETEESETYSTVVLPVRSANVYDATIYWGDGTSTKLQNKVNGITLTNDQIIEKVTHCYTLAEDDDGIRIIEISGKYTFFSTQINSTSNPTKAKLIEIEQWGNVGLVNFLFVSCKNLESMPDDFHLPEGATGMSQMFDGCTSLSSLPENFIIPDTVTNMAWAFRGCNNLKGTITIEGNPTTYTQCFSGVGKKSDSTLTVNYSKNCTNIDSILATGNSAYVVKGDCIDEEVSGETDASGNEIDTVS